jgi:flagellar hook-basal body complex protein FliE
MRDVSLQPVLGPLDKVAVPATTAKPAAVGDFGAALKAALDGVNASQSQAEALARGFQTGEGDVSLEETMVSIAKANVSFQTLVQVRSRLVAAYHDIMNMQV